jgi:hypothetical protein
MSSTSSDRPAAVAGGLFTGDAAYTPASGWVLFASVMILMSGIFNAFYGVIGFFRSIYFIGRPVYGDVWIWALLLLVFGIVEIAAAAAIMSGRSWGRWFGIVVAGLNALLNLSAVSLYPWWSVAIIAFDVLVIIGLTVGWQRAAEEVAA